MKNYKWKIPSFAKGIDANKAQKELSKIEKKHGGLTPEAVIKEATPINSLLHKIFEWDNSKAGNNYRLQQARSLVNNIEIIIVSDDSKTHCIDVYEIVKNKESGNKYKHIETLTYNEQEQVRIAILNSLRQLQAKLKIYKNFDQVLEYMQSTILELEKTIL